MNNTLRIESTNDANGFRIRAAYFTIGSKSLSDLDREFRKGKSNERMQTVARSVKEYGPPEVPKLLIGKKFVIDTSGEPISCGVTRFSKQVMDATSLVTYQDDGFYSDEDKAEPLKQEALKLKEVLKGILYYSRVLFTNPSCQSLMVIEVTGEAYPEMENSAATALFSNLLENTNISFAEVGL